jgi:hypothetical protein
MTLAPDGIREMILKRPFRQLERSRGNDDDGCIGASCDLLTCAAVAVKHQERLSRAFVADGSALAAPGDHVYFFAI